MTGGTRHDYRQIGDAGFGPTIIQITGLGERVMLAKMISHGCLAVGHHDAQAWSLGLREWCRIKG
jgi:hypothetical protein